MPIPLRLLGLLPLLPIAAAAGDLSDLAALVPATAPPPVHLALPQRTDLPRIPSGEPARAMAGWMNVFPPAFWGLDHWEATAWEAGESWLGLPVADIAGLADWGVPPDSAGAMLFAEREVTGQVASFLRGRGYAMQVRSGYPVWWLGEDDYKMDLTRRLEDGYVGQLGRSARVALTGTGLIAAHGWGPIESWLGAGRGLTADEDTAALVGAVETAGYGEAYQLLLLGPQRRLADDGFGPGSPTGQVLAALHRAAGGPPSYVQSALAAWVDETGRSTAALVLLARDEAGAGVLAALLAAVAAAAPATPDLAGWREWAEAARAEVTPAAQGALAVWHLADPPDPGRRGPAPGLSSLMRLWATRNLWILDAP